MCGRFTLTATPEALNQLFPLFDGIELQPQYNVAPTQNVLAVRLKPGTDQPEAVRLRWGLVPSWAQDGKIGYKLINARVETARTSPAFRAAFKRRHCLVLADGFYEWKKVGKTKQPYHIHLAKRQPFAFAGLWERWEGGEKPMESCTILTTAANETVQPVHNRMPMMLDTVHAKRWLADAEDEDNGMGDLVPLAAEAMTTAAVNPIVNNARNNVPECLQAVDHR